MIGYPKSGTTLTINLLDNHPELMVLSQETGVYSKISNYLKDEKYATKEEKLDAIINYISTDTNLRILGLGKSEDSIGGNYNYENFNYNAFLGKLRKQLLNSDLTSKELLLAIIQSFHETSETFNTRDNFKYWVEKTPRHYEYVPRIKLDFPQAKFIQLIRDPRDNWVSYKKKKGDKINLANFCYCWKEAVDLAFRNLNNLGEGTFLYIKYEDLVLETEKNTKTITKFMGITFSENLLIPSKYGKRWFGNSMWNERN